jgi:polyphosphate kinase 2 (PPK2 family)
VHPEILANQKLPKKLVTKRIWEERFEDMRSFERYLARQGYLILKFFLNVSKKEQKGRFLERLDRPEKNWKFSISDANERGHWDDYMTAYEELIRETAAPHAPWYVVPADKKWFTRLVVAAAINEAVGNLGLAYPKVDAAKKAELAAAREALGGKAKGEEGKPAKADEGAEDAVED